MGALIGVVLPVFLVIGFGYVAVWQRVFSDAGVDGLMRFTQRFAIPCLLFSAIAELDLAANFAAPVLVSFYLGASASFAIGTGAARLLGRPWEDCVAIGFCCLFSNSVLLGLPIAERAYGAASLSTNFAIIAVHSPFCYAVGITAMEVVRSSGMGARRMIGAVLNAMFRNALIIGITAGFVVNLSGLTLPAFLTEAIDLMVQAALPAALFGLGGVLYRYKPEGDLRVISMIVVCSLVVHPSIVLATGMAFGLDRPVLNSAVITAAMAPGINTYLFADLYGRARRVAATGVLAGTAISVLSVWLWLQFLG